MMKELIQQFAAQIEESIAIAARTKLSVYDREIRQVVISGLGGSGIGGTIVADLAKSSASVPVMVNKEYDVPAFVNEHTLFIASSYSGDTEETLMAVEKAIARHAKVICITSGGKLREIAEKNGLDVLVIPGGNPPRACLGYSFTQLVNILCHYEILPQHFFEELKASVEFIRKNTGSITASALSTAKSLFGKTIVIYADATMEGVAVRFRQQLNENAKMLCWHHVVPEMNHNELVGWTEKNENMAVIFIRNVSDFERNKFRMDINKKVISDYTPHIFELYSEGATQMERIVYLVHLCDWISFFLSEIRGVDVMEIRVIDYLKGELANL